MLVESNLTVTRGISFLVTACDSKYGVFAFGVISIRLDCAGDIVKILMALARLLLQNLTKAQILQNTDYLEYCRMEINCMKRSSVSRWSEGSMTVCAWSDRNNRKTISENVNGSVRLM